MSLPAEVAEVLEGKRRWAVVCADNRDVLPMLADKSVAHVIADPPYEAEAHTLRRRVKRGDGDGSNAKWGGGRRTPCTTNPSPLRPSPTASGGGRRDRSPESRCAGRPSFVRWRRR